MSPIWSRGRYSSQSLAPQNKEGKSRQFPGEDTGKVFHFRPKKGPLWRPAIKDGQCSQRASQVASRLLVCLNSQL
jgi:hypothetical protein